MVKKTSSEFLKWFPPILDALRDLGGSGKPQEVCDWIAKKLELPDSFLEERLNNGQSRFQNQVAWARQYLVWEGLLDSSVRGTWTLTQAGYETKLDDEKTRKIFLKQIALYQATRKKKASEQQIIEEQEEIAPENSEATNISSLLELLQRLTPAGFEQICGMLLRESGFENITVTGRSHDGGIDGHGTLEMNPFVSFKVLFQCKKYQGTVGRSHVGDFRNAMIGRAEKGIIITTGSFSQEAIKEANREGAPKVELVDGEKLIEMFKKVELGVRPKTIYEIDLRFFEPFFEKK
jgi:restriction system protein